MSETLPRTCCQWIASVAIFEKKMEEKGREMEEPILARAKKARVLRIQDQIDRCSEPLIGEYYCLIFSYVNFISMILYYVLNIR